MTMPADRSNDRRSLQDLAKMAQLTPPPPSSVATAAPSSVPGAAKKDDSGIIDLAAASMADPTAETRAQSTPLASQGLFDEDNSVRPPPISQAPVSKAPISQAPISQAPISQAAVQPAPSLPPVSVAPASVPAVAQLAQANASANEKKGSGGKVIALVLGGVVALSAAAAGTFFFMKHRTVTAPVVTVTTPTVVAPEPPPPATTATTAAAEPAPEATPEPDLANNKMALAPKTPAKGAAPAAPKHEAPKGEAKPESSKLTEKDLAAQNTGPAGALGDEMRKAVGGGNDQPTPAAAATGANAATGNVPQKPSQGAVTGALGAVLPSARACVTADAPISRATIVFGSAGSVQSVTVSGGAVGTPAEACIKGALMQAKIQPFAEPTYSAPVTIRHN